MSPTQDSTFCLPPHFRNIPVNVLYPSKRAGSDPHPVWISTEALARSGPSDSCTHRLCAVMKKAVCGRTQPSLKVGNSLAGCLRSARSGPDDSCTPTCFQTRSVWPMHDKAVKMGSGLALHNMIPAFFARMEQNRTREIRSGTSDLAQFWSHAGRPCRT